MIITAVSKLSSCDTVLRFLSADTPVSFEEPHLQAAYKSLFANDSLTLEHMEICSMRLPFREEYITLLLAGFDNQTPHPYDDLRKLTAKVGTKLRELRTVSLFIDHIGQLTFDEEPVLLTQLCSILPLCEYSFDAHLSQKKPCPEISAGILTDFSMQPFLSEGLVLAQSVMTARDLVNETADILTPEKMAEQAEELGNRFGFQTEILDEQSCKELGMNLFLAVSKGSVLPPRFIILRWNGASENDPPIALVGKGITYDTGGLAIKTSSMELMNYDMNGAAAVIGAMCAAARQKLPCNVIAVIAACENAVDAKSCRNGDIVTSMSGQSVYIRNTDAEGRLSMADAITYCARYEHPKEILEIAGLTGSVCSFYGKVCAAALTSTQSLFDRLNSVTKISGEKYAQMPAFDEYRELLKTPFADLNNSPANEPGGILAALFLDCFHDDIPFLSIDTGAMPFTRTASDCQPAGGTGFGVRSLYYYLKHSCCE